MNAATILVVLAVCFAQINCAEYEKPSEDCIWGREDAASCCKNIEDGNPAHLANPKECSSFYLCKNNEPVLWPCLPGQIWSVAEQKCVKSSTPNECAQVTFRRIALRKASEDCIWGREDAASCCKNIPDGDPTHLANPKECSSFYLCKNNEPVLWPCLPGQIWSVAEQKCVKSSTPNECAQVTFRRIALRKASEDCIWGREDAASCCKNIPDGDPTHLANPKECSSFYLCKNNEPVLWPCLPGQIWSVAEQKCVKSSTPNECAQVTFRRIALRKASEDCIWGREDAASCCKNIPDGDPTHLANPKECSSFYLCKNNEPVLWPCLPGQIWSVAEQKCVKSSTPNECAQVTFRRIALRKASEDCIWGREDAASCCKNIPDGDPTHLANPKECSSFYLCKNNEPVLWPCLPGQIWSVAEQKCVKSSTPNECAQVTFRRIALRKASEDCIWGREDAASCCKNIPDGDPTHLANPKECSSFYLCKNNEPVLWPCLPGQIWSVAEQKCVKSSTPNECAQVTFRRIALRKASEDCIWGREDAASCCKNIPDGDPTHLANPKECSSFYLCKNNEPVLWPCLPGQIWSVAEQKCVKSSTPNECAQVTFRRIALRKASEDCIWGREDAASCCKNIPDGDPTHLANPKECSSFYLCKNNEPVLWPCLPGQIWSVAEQKCVKSSTPNECAQVTFRRIALRKASEDCIWGREDAASCCKNIPDGDPTHLANPKECSSFYLCKNNEPVLWPCLPGQIWSVAEQKCVKSSTPNECAQVTFRRIALRKASEDCIWGREDAASCCKNIPDGDPTHLANPKECSSFYLCKNNEPVLWPCLPGQIWSVAEQKCVKSSTPNECAQVTFRRIALRKASEDCIWGREDAASCCKNIPDGDPTHLANPKECSSFYLCKNNEPVLWPCLPGQIWSVAEQKCVKSSTPKECAQVNFRRIILREVSEDCIWGREDAASCCKNIPDGDPTHLANPKECSSFYLCKNNEPVLWPCLPGQIWSVAEQKCVKSSTPNECAQAA